MTLDIELFTTKELINELVSRNTFVGVLIYSTDEHKLCSQFHNDFILHGLESDEETIHLLEIGLDSIKRKMEGTD